MPSYAGTQQGTWLDPGTDKDLATTDSMPCLEWAKALQMTRQTWGGSGRSWHVESARLGIRPYCPPSNLAHTWGASVCGACNAPLYTGSTRGAAHRSGATDWGVWVHTGAVEKFNYGAEVRRLRGELRGLGGSLESSLSPLGAPLGAQLEKKGCATGPAAAGLSLAAAAARSANLTTRALFGGTCAGTQLS